MFLAFKNRIKTFGMGKNGPAAIAVTLLYTTFRNSYLVFIAL